MTMTNTVIRANFRLGYCSTIYLILKNTSYLDVTVAFFEAIFCSEFNFVTPVSSLVECIIYLNEWCSFTLVTGVFSINVGLIYTPMTFLQSFSVRFHRQGIANL